MDKKSFPSIINEEGDGLYKTYHLYISATFWMDVYDGGDQITVSVKKGREVILETEIHKTSNFFKNLVEVINSVK